jgi:hypothetical protein
VRFFVQLTVVVAVLWSVVAAVAAIDPGAAYRAQQFIQGIVGRGA